MVPGVAVAVLSPRGRLYPGVGLDGVVAVGLLFGILVIAVAARRGKSGYLLPCVGLPGRETRIRGVLGVSSGLRRDILPQVLI